MLFSRLEKSGQTNLLFVRCYNLTMDNAQPVNNVTLRADDFTCGAKESHEYSSMVKTGRLVPWPGCSFEISVHSLCNRRRINNLKIK